MKNERRKFSYEEEVMVFFAIQSENKSRSSGLIIHGEG